MDNPNLNETVYEESFAIEHKLFTLSFITLLVSFLSTDSVNKLLFFKEIVISFCRMESLKFNDSETSHEITYKLKPFLA